MARPGGLRGWAFAAAWVLLAAVAAPAAGQQNPDTARGFEAGKVYEFGDLDAVNLFNGNLSLRLPIGSVYPADGELSLAMALTYNSNLWRHHGFKWWAQDESVVDSTVATLEETNAGPGWRLSFGELQDAVYPQNDGTQWVFKSADGTSHAFYDTLHPGETAQSGVSYSRDGSYLRLVRVSANTYDVEAADGSSRRFVRTSGLPESPFRLAWIEDAFGNRVTVSDLVTTSTFSDGHRTQQIIWRELGNDGDVWRVVDRVVLTAFGGQTATYTFNYAAATLQESAFDTYPNNSPFRAAHLLTSITLPDGSSWQMDYYTSRSEGSGSDLSAAENQPGAIRRLTLPTLGAYEWTYQDYAFPSRVNSGPTGGGTLVLAKSTGVKRKRVLGYGGACEAYGEAGCEWHYRWGETPPVYRWTTVTYPSGDETVFYFDEKPRPDPADYTGWEYGLPFARAIADGNGHYLSRRVYDGTSTGGTLLRETWVAYERDAVTTGAEQVLPHFWENSNRREKRRRTVYLDDGGRHRSVERSRFDGLGHYRQVVRDGNLPGGAARTETTEYNAGRGDYTVNLATNGVSGGYQPWPTTAPWVLGTFSERRQTESGATAVERFCFDAATGALVRRRILRGGALGSTDLIAAWTFDLKGDVTAEAFYGGDTQAVTTAASWCTAGLGEPSYRRTFSYDHGVRETSRWDGETYFDLDLTIDPSTGLPSANRDPSGIETTFAYDTSGRVTSERPQSGHGAWAQYQWFRATSSASPARVDVQVKNNSGTTVLARSEQQWDALGRPSRHRVLGADGLWSSVVTVHDAMGRRFSVSERQAGFPSRYTFYRSYDPFDRPTRVEPPDDPGHRVLFWYSGDRVVQRDDRVCGPPGGCASSAAESGRQVFELYDRHGRLYQVIEPSGAGGANVTTTYGYDVGNRLRSVSTAGQNRTLSYDHRGLLTSECHPEKGVSGNGCVSYQSYDALGNLGRKLDGPFDLRYVYDAAGRLTAVNERTGGAIRPLKVFNYADANAGTDRKLGKLEFADRYNYVELNSTPQNPNPLTVRVRETYRYAGVGGAVSGRDTEFYVGGSPVESFTQGFTWSDLGEVATLDYPRCTHAACTAPAPKTQSFGYRNGFLTSVPGYATSLTYHPNGMSHQVIRTNGVTDTRGADPAGLRRPASISTAGASADWSSGTHRYDGAGNLHRIGGSTYAYDGVNRLVAATVDLGDGGHCPGDLTLANQTLSGLHTHESCAALLAGPALTVAAGADVTFRAAERVVLRGGFAVAAGATFRAGTDPSLFGSGSGGATTSRTYAYDVHGNLTAIGGDGGRNLPVSATTNRLTTAGHDAAGNVTSWNGRTFSYDALGLMWGQSRPTADPNDPNGFEEWLYFYTADDEKAWSYHFSGSDWTLRDLDGRVLRHYRHVGTDWSVERNYVYANGRLLAGTKPGVTTYHYHLDHLGSPRLVTDATGSRQAFHVYYPYGEEATPPDQDGERMKFTGHEREFAAESGTNPAADDLDYMHARWHNPLTGRFMSVDPVGGNPWAPQSFNRYAYVLGNPVNYVDPYGLRAGDADEPFTDEITVCADVETGGECRSLDDRTTDQASFGNFLFGNHAGAGSRRSAFDIGFPGMSVRQYAAMAGDTGECDWSCQVMSGVVFDSYDGIKYMEMGVVTVSEGWLLSGAGAFSIFGETTGSFRLFGATHDGLRFWSSARSRGGGARLLRGGQATLGADWHAFKLRGQWANRPHYHRGPTRSQFGKHRPWEGRR